jgi:putative membrane protein insertion efficiency factor
VAPHHAEGRVTVTPLGRWPRRLVAGLIRGYQLALSPLLPPSCRFYPSCSQFALEAVTRHGALKGSWLAARRLARCHPFHPGGYDPVP